MFKTILNKKHRKVLWEFGGEAFCGKGFGIWAECHKASIFGHIKDDDSIYQVKEVSWACKLKALKAV